MIIPTLTTEVYMYLIVVNKDMVDRGSLAAVSAH